MSRFKNFVGINTRKECFDAALIKSGNSTQIIRHQFAQDVDGFAQMQEWLQMFQVQLYDDTLFCIEHTGLYNAGIVNHLVKYNAQLCLRVCLKSINAVLYQKSCDEGTIAVAIARFGLRYCDIIKLWQPSYYNMEKINQLVAQRDRLIYALEYLESPVEALKYIGYQVEAIQLHKNQKAALAILKKTRLDVERVIANIVKQDEQVYKKAKLVESMKNWGTFTVWHIIGSYKKLVQLR